MTPAMQAALAAQGALIFGAVEIALPGYTLRLLDGAGRATIGGNVFVARDATFGTIAAITDLTDGDGDQAPTLSLTLLPPSDTAAATLASPLMQGSPVRIYFGAIDRATGLVIPDPERPFTGALDVPTITWDRGSREIDYEIVSTFEKFFDLEEGARLADGFHQSVWPGERGLEFVTGVTQKVYWGLLAPASSSISYGGGQRGSFGDFRADQQ